MALNRPIYNVKHPKYHLKEERIKNLRLLAEKLSEKNIETAIPWISKKMLSLENHFFNEKRKIETSSQKPGFGVSDFSILNGSYIATYFSWKITLLHALPKQI